MRLVFTLSAWDDYLWFQSHDRKLLKRINLIIQDVLRSPFQGIGKPEPLNGELAGFWSRRSMTSIGWSTPPQRLRLSSSPVAFITSSGQHATKR